jgi:dTDP-4-amino-4,6-dideoxygalactose transaminase
MAAPYFSAEDRARIHREVDLILDGALSMGPNVRAFEREFSEMCGAKHAIAMNSCTAALETALVGLGVRSGDEVIVPAETFIATGMAVHLVGGRAVFAEILESTFCLDLDDVDRRVTSRTKGVIWVHMGGLIAPNLAEVRAYCDRKKLFLVEDAAHAPGATLDGRGAGTIGHAGCFSFFPTKVMTSGDGGMFTTNDDALAAFARSLQHRGRDMAAPTEQYALPGRNVRMTEMTALLGRVQLSHLAEFLAQRRAIGEVYRTELEGDSQLRVIVPDDLTSSAFWKVPVVLAPTLDRDALTRGLKEVGIVVDWAYQPALHLQPVFRALYGATEGLLPRSEDLLSRHICLPCHPRMSLDDARYVARALKEASRLPSAA